MAITTRYYATSTYFPNSGTKLPYDGAANALGTGANYATGYSSKIGSSYELGLKFNFSSLPSNAVVTKLQVGMRSYTNNYQGAKDYFTLETFLGGFTGYINTSVSTINTSIVDINYIMNKQNLIDNAYVLLSGRPNATSIYTHNVDYVYVDVTYELTPSKIYIGDNLLSGMRRDDLACIVYRGDYLL